LKGGPAPFIHRKPKRGKNGKINAVHVHQLFELNDVEPVIWLASFHYDCVIPSAMRQKVDRRAPSHKQGQKIVSKYQASGMYAKRVSTGNIK
jgi:hypothetical protein